MCVVCVVCFTLIQNPSSDIFAQRDQHENYCSVRFCLATSEPIECCYRTKPGIGRGQLHCARWVDQISFTNVVLFIKSPFEIHDGTKSFLDYSIDSSVAPGVRRKTLFVVSMKTTGTGSPVVALLFNLGSK